jgi:hypothetical protein
MARTESLIDGSSNASSHGWTDQRILESDDDKTEKNNHNTNEEEKREHRRNFSSCDVVSPLHNTTASAMMEFK